MTDPYLMTRKESAGTAAVVFGLGVVIALFEGWILDTAAREGLTAVFRGRPVFYAVLAPVILAAALVGLGVGSYRSGRYLFSNEGQGPSATAGAIVGVAYALMVMFVFASKYYRLGWTEGLGTLLLVALGLFVVGPARVRIGEAARDG